MHEETLVLDDPLSARTSRFVDGSNIRKKEERSSNAWAPVYCDRGPRRGIGAFRLRPGVRGIGMRVSRAFL
jgi:hypothetical protein